MEVPPSPKVHAQLLGDPVELSTKFTVSGAMPLVGDPLKFATGGPVGGGGAPPNVS